MASAEIKSQMTKMELLVNVSLQQNDLYNPFDDCWEILGSKDDGFGSKSDGHLRKGFDWLSNQSIPLSTRKWSRFTWRPITTRVIENIKVLLI